MYIAIKTLIKKALPQRVLFVVEPFVRWVLYQFYRGSSHQCNICGKSLSRFVTLADGDELCPRCGSISRHRRLWAEIKPHLNDGVSVLDFSPARSIYRKAKGIRSIRYKGTDLSGDFLSDLTLDITNIDLPDSQFDLIVCYHILEHIEADAIAMAELFRVLKPNGTCFVQTPFKDGDIYENPQVKTDAERLLHFGQSDHVRIYSIAALKERLERAGFSVTVKHFDATPHNWFGFKTAEDVLICQKPAATN